MSLTGYLPYPLWMAEVVDRLAPEQCKVFLQLLGMVAPFGPYEALDRLTGAVVTLPRGTLLSSQRDLARKMGCTRALVRSTQGLLEKAGFLAQVPTQGQTIYLCNLYEEFEELARWYAQQPAQGVTQGPPSSLYKTVRSKKGRTRGKKNGAGEQLPLGWHNGQPSHPDDAIAVCPFCFRRSCLEGTDRCERAGGAEPVTLTKSQLEGLGNPEAA